MEKGKHKFIDPNIERKGKILKNHLSEQEDSSKFPIFSLIEFNLVGLCTRKCIFCPRHDPKIFPNVNEHMPVDLYEKILKDLKKIDYDGTFLYSAFGEPLLYRDLEKVISLSKQYCPKVRIEIVSNGDLVTAERVSRLFDAGLTVFSVSMYDGPHQQEHFKEIQKQVGLRDDQFILRVRWLPRQEQFGITLSNRAGALEMKDVGVVIPKEPLKRPCYYPFYQILVDYNGDVIMCPHDWGKKLIAGNINNDSILDIWNNDILKKARLTLAKQSRNFPPCNLCDVEGTFMGKSHFDKYVRYYNTQELMAMNKQFKGKYVLVTGTNSGIGFQIAKDFLLRGAFVGAHYYNDRKGAEQLLQYSKPGQCKLFEADFFDSKQALNMWKEFISWSKGRIDVLVNNAGQVQPRNLKDLTEEVWDKVFQVNLKTPFLLSREAFFVMSEQKSGRIINISSIGIKFGGSPTSIHYSASKAALEAITKSFAKAGAPFNVLVNTVRPGVTNTPLHKKTGKDLSARTAFIPLKRIAEPSEISNAVIFLASRESSFITNTVIDVAGGE